MTCAVVGSPPPPAQPPPSWDYGEYAPYSSWISFRNTPPPKDPEKPQPGEPTSPWYNAGVYTFRPSIFDYTAVLEKSPRGEYELTDAIRALAQSGRLVQAFELQGDWADVRDPEVLAVLNRV